MYIYIYVYIYLLLTVDASCPFISIRFPSDFHQISIRFHQRLNGIPAGIHRFGSIAAIAPDLSRFNGRFLVDRGQGWEPGTAHRSMDQGMSQWILQENWKLKKKKKIRFREVSEDDFFSGLKCQEIDPKNSFGAKTPIVGEAIGVQPPADCAKAVGIELKTSGSVQAHPEETKNSCPLWGPKPGKSCYKSISIVCWMWRHTDRKGFH